MEESDCAIVLMKLPNKEAKASAEAAEGRARTKENDVHHHTYPTQSGMRVSQGLGSVRRTAQARKQERFTSLLHHLTVGLLRESYYAFKAECGPGSRRRKLAGVWERRLTDGMFTVPFHYAPAAARISQ